MNKNVQEMLSKAAEARKRRQREVAETRVDMDDGWSVYKDSPPGIGWVLHEPARDRKTGAIKPLAGKKRYYMTKEEAVEAHRRYET